MLTSISKLLGVVALAAAVGLSGPGVASAGPLDPPSDGGDSSCTPDKRNCHLFHFKLDGRTHSMEFTTHEDSCTSGRVRTRFTVTRKNSANIWLNPDVTKYFYIQFDGRPAADVQGMDTRRCGNGGMVTSFVNTENKCWYLTELRTRGDACDWG